MPETVPIPRPLPEQLVDLIAQRFRVLGEPMRIKLLDRLRDGEATGGELQEALDASQQNVSKHLGVLLQAGMVSRTKRGTSSVFAIADDGVFELCDQVCGGLRRQLSELDAILQGLVEEELSVQQIVSRGFLRDTVTRVQRLLYAAEYKRRQAPPGVKITRKSFGRDRRYPLTNAFREL